MSHFTGLGLAAPILKALSAKNYVDPTPIQIQSIPVVLAGSDVLAIAQTGTGKTAAFALPILHRLADSRRHAGDRGCRTLVLAPTRELAAQIGEAFRAYGRFLGLSTAVVFGGASMVKQKQALARGVDVVVATPGRLLDHVEQRSLKLDRVEILVLDEADHMLDMGFIRDLRRIAGLTPSERQTLLFSATMPREIAELAAQFMRNPVEIAVTPPATTVERVDQAVIHIDGSRKQDLLHSLAQDRELTRGLIFTRTKHGADRVVKRLLEAGHAAEAIHGNKSQGQRERSLAAFRSGRARLLVATEIAARGIDVKEVSHVINFDLPDAPDQYVHRIGRTARAGGQGRAISFCAPDERGALRDIERRIKISIPVMPHALSMATPSADERPRSANGPKGRPPFRGRKPSGGGRDNASSPTRGGREVWSNNGRRQKFGRER